MGLSGGLEDIVIMLHRLSSKEFVASDSRGTYPSTSSHYTQYAFAHSRSECSLWDTQSLDYGVKTRRFPSILSGQPATCTRPPSGRNHHATVLMGRVAISASTFVTVSLQCLLYKGSASTPPFDYSYIHLILTDGMHSTCICSESPRRTPIPAGFFDLSK